jgi:hypothetical protein
MLDNRWAKAIADSRKELARIESNSRTLSRRFEMLQLEAESLKVEFLEYSLQKQRTAVARQRGFAFLIRDRKKVRTGLAVSGGAFFIGGLIAKDKDAALNAGLSGFYGVLQELGETRWAVSLQKELVIVPYDAIRTKGMWVTFESLIAAIHDLKTEALQGKRLGTLDDIIERLQQQNRKLVHITLSN